VILGAWIASIFLACKSSGLRILVALRTKICFRPEPWKSSGSVSWAFINKPLELHTRKCGSWRA
jgi:hypothetical protein